MSDTMLRYQCPACGAPLEFSSEKQLLVCDSCDSEFPRDIIRESQGAESDPRQTAPGGIDWNIEGYVRNTEDVGEQPGFICEACGAEVVSDGNTVASECMYCGNPVVMTGNVSGMLTPDLVLPFQIDKAKATQMLEEFYKGKPLLPDAFTQNNRLQKISGVYVPFWLFSCEGQGRVNFAATKVRRWSDSDYDYTKTETYEILRGGQIGFDKIPVDASLKMEDNYMDGIEPFDYSQMQPFDTMYMAGYFADKFDVGVGESAERANRRVISSVEDAFRKTVQGYHSVQQKHAFVQMQGKRIDYALLPVWMLNTKYDGKMYQFAINGQTGKVSGELPVDPGKLLKWRVLLTLATAIPVAAAALFFFL